MGRPSLREQIIDAGVTLLHERGYSACGVREITQAAGVPLGSFTNHFSSKEAFAVTVLDRYMDVLLTVAAHTLGDCAKAPINRITSYFAAIEEIAVPLQWRFGCMLANLGLELSTHSDLVRQRLLKGLEDLTLPFIEALDEGQTRGQVRSDLPPDELAIVVLSAWHGALLRAKIEQLGTAPHLVARSLPILLRPIDV